MIGEGWRAFAWPSFPSQLSLLSEHNNLQGLSSCNKCPSHSVLLLFLPSISVFLLFSLSFLSPSPVFSSVLFIGGWGESIRAVNLYSAPLSTDFCPLASKIHLQIVPRQIIVLSWRKEIKQWKTHSVEQPFFHIMYSSPHQLCTGRRPMENPEEDCGEKASTSTERGVHMKIWSSTDYSDNLLLGTWAIL